MAFVGLPLGRRWSRSAPSSWAVPLLALLLSGERAVLLARFLAKLVALRIEIGGSIDDTAMAFDPPAVDRHFVFSKQLAQPLLQVCGSRLLRQVTRGIGPPKRVHAVASDLNAVNPSPPMTQRQVDTRKDRGHLRLACVRNIGRTRAVANDPARVGAKPDRPRSTLAGSKRRIGVAGYPHVNPTLGVSLASSPTRKRLRRQPFAARRCSSIAAPHCAADCPSLCSI